MTRRIFTVAFFDFDGVIVESAGIKVQAFLDCLPSEPPAVRDAIREYATRHGGVSRFGKFRYIHERILARPLTADALDQLCERYRCLVLEQVERAPFVPGARELLEAIHQTTDCYVVSGTPQDELREIVKGRGLADFFKEVVGSPATKTTLIEGIARRYARRDHMVFIGDTITDLDAARETGLAFLGVAAGADRGGLPAEVEITSDLSAYRPRFSS